MDVDQSLTDDPGCRLKIGLYFCFCPGCLIFLSHYVFLESNQIIACDLGKMRTCLFSRLVAFVASVPTIRHRSIP